MALHRTKKLAFHELHLLARISGTEHHLVAILWLLAHQPYEAGLLLAHITTASKSPTITASVEGIGEDKAPKKATCENVTYLAEPSSETTNLPAFARIATPAMAETCAAVRTRGAAPTAPIVRAKVASVLGTQVTTIRSEASPRDRLGRI